jgi:hypothetical protein
MAFLWFLSTTTSVKNRGHVYYLLNVKNPAGRAMCIACVALIAATLFFLVAVVFNPLKS